MTGSPVAKVIHNFGRADKVDREALAPPRLFDLPVPGARRGGSPRTSGSEVEIVDSRRFGGAYVLRRALGRLGIADALTRAARDGASPGEVVERVLFALVAQRCLEPGSKLAATPGRKSASRSRLSRPSTTRRPMRRWTSCWTRFPRSRRASSIARRTLFNLSCDVIFVDTSSTYFELDVPDPRVELDTAAGEARGAKEAAEREGDPAPERGDASRSPSTPRTTGRDLPQVVLGMAVTAEGIPIRCWTFPGTTSDQAIIRTIKDDLGGLDAQPGGVGGGLRLQLRRRTAPTCSEGGGHYIVGEKLRGGERGPRPHWHAPGAITTSPATWR